MPIAPHLLERFDTPSRWKWTRATAIEWEGEFKIAPVIYAVSVFRKNSLEDIWELSFSARTKTKDYGYVVSGTGNAWKVFATVVQMGTRFVQSNHPRSLLISSDTTHRTRFRVNRRIAQEIAERTNRIVRENGGDLFIEAVKYG
jgi:hypothetical protein